MKEYIDREELVKRFNVLYYNMLDNLEKMIYSSPLSKLTDIPKADVIEREKIDRAIEEIQKLRGCSCSCSDGIIDDVEDILDKLIESGEDNGNT